MSLILGLNAYHGDSAACVFKDGKLVAAAEEERFRRIKHWAGLPTEAVQYCLREAGAKIGDVEHIAINRKPGVNNLRRLQFMLMHWPDPRLVMQKIRNIRKASTASESLETALGVSLKAQVHHVEHHLAHLASAFLVSGFEEAACLSVDGFGDFASTAMAYGHGSHIDISTRVYFPHSLGVFYSAITQFIGFPHFGDEYKVMGLAPYGQPTYLPQMREIVRVQSDGTFKLNLRYFRHHTGNVSYSWNNCAPEVGVLHTDALSDLLGPKRQPAEPLEQKHKDIARSAQAMYEEAFFALLSALHKKHRSENLALSGGCAMNSVANGKVYLNTPFRRMYLPASAGDAGGAIGAAAVVNAECGFPNAKLESAYSGPEFSDDEIDPLLRARGLAPPRSDIRNPQSEFSVERIADATELCRRTAQAISEGKVIGWFQGRMEWGPRALGNRSILGDPRRADMKEILNAKIKRRESFRPFAPSILREAVSEWFEQDDDVPFMMEVFQIRPEKRAAIPAVCHVDGSGRLQTVHRETNPLYHELITSFRELTSVPLVLNTSFNENEPVVCCPEEALDCFLRTKMDVLVLGSFFVERQN
ncbi:MAG TPA: carbamoyltransferase C-terminal domain-containing protein [Chthoniobacterales bacterium]|nr:carbamoyltransferase C-terminal domain-containing protein [Chthoniobacterales bacterium]